MKTPLFFIFCIVALFPIIEAAPWFRQNPTKRYGVTKSENNGAADTEIKSTGRLTRGDQNTDEKQDFDTEGVDDHGGNRYQGGRGFQAGRDIQGGRRPQDGLGNKSFEGSGGWGNLGGRGYPGSRRNEGGRNQDSGEDRRRMNSESEDDSHDTGKPKHGCRGCRWTNIGNGFSNDNKVFLYDD